MIKLLLHGVKHLHSLVDDVWLALVLCKYENSNAVVEANKEKICKAR